MSSISGQPKMPKKKVNPWLVLSVTSLGVTLVMLNLGALNVALPAIAIHFHAGAALANWILLSFMLVNTVLILVFGQFSDSFGRKELYLWGMGVFTIVSFVIGFTTNVWTFLILRALQAAGGALIITNNTALLTDAFPEVTLGKGLSANVIVSSAAQLVGPVIGGVIATQFGWQWVFWAGVPIGIIGVVWGYMVLRHLPNNASGKPIDWIGGVITFVALSGLIVSLSEGSTLGWGNLFVLSGFAVFVFLTPILFIIEKRMKTPMFDFTLFHDLSFTMANVSAFLNSFARVSVVLLISLYLQTVMLENAFQAGIAVLPVTIGMLIASPLAGNLSSRFSARILSSLGLFISAIGLIILIFTIHPSFHYFTNGIGMGLVGFGSGLFLTPNTKSIMISVPSSRRGFANGLRSMLQNMGQVMSTAISITIVTAALPPSLHAAVMGEITLPRTATMVLTKGYHWAIIALLIATILGIVVSLLRGKTKKI